MEGQARLTRFQYVVYVFYGAEKAFLYYARRHAFRSTDYVLGRCARDAPGAEAALETGAQST